MKDTTDFEPRKLRHLASSLSFRYTAVAHSPDRTPPVDFSPRNRYRARRRTINARRRRITVIAGGIALALLGIGLTVWRLRAQPSKPPALPLAPTGVAHTTALPTMLARATAALPSAPDAPDDQAAVPTVATPDVPPAPATFFDDRRLT